MLSREEMEGIYALVPTPFARSGKFDERTFRENLRKLCKAGIHGIVTTGTVGEFNTISWEDHQRLIEALVEETAKSQQTRAIAGCSAVNTKEAIKKTKFAEECGADAVMNVVPFYQVLNEKEVIGYYTDIAEACPNIGIIVYNNPFTGRVLHNARTFAKLARIPTLLGSKETTLDFSHWMQIVKISKLAFMHIDTLFVPTMMWGGKGCFSFVACMMPELILRAYAFCKEGRWEEAIKLQYKINDLLAPYFVSGYKMRPAGDPSVYKPMVEAAGFLKCGAPGKPYAPIPNNIRKRLEENVRRKMHEIMAEEATATPSEGCKGK